MKDVPKRLVTLKDLCLEDKQRVANLIKELARWVELYGEIYPDHYHLIVA